MSGPGFTVPPGRAGRLWLTRRLAVARRGADLLDRKHRILLAVTARLRDAAAQTAAEWDRCCADAERWLLRASMLGGERAIRLGAAGALRAVEAEALATRYRLRAVKNRWIPRLEQALADVTLALEEQELADSARLRLSARSGRVTLGPKGLRAREQRP